jgi:hypothetical protein
MTQNQKYGGLNRRFDRRAARLIGMGFKYVQAAPGVGAFIKTKYSRDKGISAGTVLYADNANFYDALRFAL